MAPIPHWRPKMELLLCIKSWQVGIFWFSRCLNNHINHPNMIGSIASDNTHSLVAKNETKQNLLAYFYLFWIKIEYVWFETFSYWGGAEGPLKDPKKPPLPSARAKRRGMECFRISFTFMEIYQNVLCRKNIFTSLRLKCNAWLKQV